MSLSLVYSIASSFMWVRGRRTVVYVSHTRVVSPFQASLLFVGVSRFLGVALYLKISNFTLLVDPAFEFADVSVGG